MTSDRLVKAYLEKAKLRIKTLHFMNSLFMGLKIGFLPKNTKKSTLTTPSKKRGRFSNWSAMQLDKSLNFIFQRQCHGIGKIR